ncbi:hypothetical protein H0E87_013229 [Populus deltoides]|uniref:Enoyl reductase (ER) domain-containing protein n=1 Tax=Populus deltoides TaxID=3696 RepID=A0A8T2YMS7_POPDE|nr:hypothetical protein H0E87_013229 [Populus deltoides]
MMASAPLSTLCLLPSQNREVNGSVMNLRSSFYGKVIANQIHIKKETGSIRRDPFVAASVLGRRKTVVPEPDYRIPVVLLGLAGGLAYTNNLLPAAPAGLLGLLLLFQTTRVKFVFDDKALEVKVGEQLQESGENVFVGGKNRWKMASNSTTLWWRELVLQKLVDQNNHKARASRLNHPAISLTFGAVVSTRKQMLLLLIDSWLRRNMSEKQQSSDFWLELLAANIPGQTHHSRSIEMEVNNRYITITKHIQGSAKESDFELKVAPLGLSVEPGSNDIIVKNLCVSIDPYQLNRMKSYSSSQKTVQAAVGITPGQPIDALGVAKVLVSDNPEFVKDDLVVGFVHWGEYSVVKGGMLRKLDPKTELPLSYHAGILGLSGLTAYAGLFEICKPKKGDKVFVSAACGSVGNLVGQYAKLSGCYVVGCAGSRDKVALLKEKLGFDDAFNYKEETDLNSALTRYFPDGIDIYFDNVGGDMLEAAVANMNPSGRVAACGTIAEYSDAAKRAAPNMMDVIYKRIKIQGFLAMDHMSLLSDFLSTTTEYIQNGKIKVQEDISIGVESIPSAFIGLFRGDNAGKKIVKIADE